MHLEVRLLVAASLLLVATPAMHSAASHEIAIATPEPPQGGGFAMGTSEHPDGTTLGLDSRSLLRDGKPWLPVMGEFHYARYPETEWREELLKMKAGGITIVATYVFWIHHEEERGIWDWTGRRDLRRFIETCREVGLLAAVRCGPWCHGEVRNGGLPDWLLRAGIKVRSDDPEYLPHARRLYDQIGDQLRGLLWRDGGPVVAIQLENEYGGPAQHLLTLKQLAREAGLDAPLYTRTGWPLLQTPMPFGEIVPLFGAYAEGFWDRELTSMPGKYWAAFQFQSVRTDAAIATEQLGERAAQDEADAHRYPYLTCELGGGMMNSYHRRIAIDPEDIESVALVKIGSGGNLPGYYMYHGGTNPPGRLTTLMEAQDTLLTNWNDMPVKSYDFYAPLGEYGQVRPHFHLLRRLHLAVHAFGPVLARMPAFFPDVRPTGRDDLQTLRWAVRSDGRSGFLFVNNRQRGATLPEHRDVQFRLRGPDGELVVPAQPVTIPSGASFFWPYNLELGDGVRLESATAQPVTRARTGDVAIHFFAAVPGIPAVLTVQTPAGERITRTVEPGRGVALEATGATGITVRLVVLSHEDSLQLWSAPWQGRERHIISPSLVVADGPVLRLSSPDVRDLTAAVYPPITDADDGVFQRVHPTRPKPAEHAVVVSRMREPGPARDIPLGRIAKPVAAAPGDGDFSEAGLWRIALPPGLDLNADARLRLHYRGDVARVMIGGQFVTDDFYNGRPLEIGLRRHAAELRSAGGELRVLILPLRRDAPIHLPEQAWPQGVSEPPVASLDSVELVHIHTAELSPRDG